ncbi:nuclear transport factor 2 family protein [Rhodococcus sp. P1Y]|uniref:nuclear transport factor 2 family protein n=1 Tax=Rhodococcus sp. P1Y TaxID=1302308 RepID=UPI000EB5510A|nr:nuclear transport factor 2 family protein [Rhodococcus sp. P1Y]AYJ48255.1 nuclear transport factor 2 family protein [Rhodococcus sp. P1Y]
MQLFRQAVEANDHETIASTLAEDVVFSSPVAFKPYHGKQTTAAILRAVTRVFEDFRYVRTVEDIGGSDHVLFFEARIDDVTIHGCDILHLNSEGLIDDFTVMVRPLSAAQALSKRMATEFAVEMGSIGSADKNG